MIRSLFLLAYKYMRFMAFLPTILLFFLGIIMGIIDMSAGLLLSNILGPVFALIIWILIGVILAWIYLCSIALLYLALDSIIKLEEIPTAINGLNTSLKAIVSNTNAKSSTTPNNSSLNATTQQNAASNNQTQTSRTQIQRKGLNIKR